MRHKIDNNPGAPGASPEPSVPAAVMESMRARAAAMRANIHPSIRLQTASLPLRRYPRTLFSVPITVRHLCRQGVRATRGISLDLGEGGLGALLDGVLVGDTVALEFRLSEQPLNIVAIVRHAAGARCGFEFVGSTPEERLRIVGIVSHN